MKTLSILLFVLCFVHLGFSSCQSGDTQKQYMLPNYGRPYSGVKEPIRLPCDTMIVRAGDTTTLNSGVMLHFGPTSSEKNVIIVRGTLLALGSQEAAVYLTGTVTAGDFGYVPAKGPWGGIRVDSGGSLNFKRVRMFEAIPALESKSENVVFKKVVLQGCMNIVDPTGKRIDINANEESIDSLNFASHFDAVPSASLPVTAKSENNERGIKPWVWPVAAGLLLLSGGALWYIESQKDSPTPPPSVNTSLFPDAPSFPGSTSRSGQ